MGAFVYLSDSEVRRWQTVPDDKDCNDILQELRSLSGENWLVGVRQYRLRSTWWEWLRRAPQRWHKVYTLYADCHGEWQVINLVTPAGGSVFHGSGQSREDVMNFMLGCLTGYNGERRAWMGRVA
jgi:hypothetical protein